MDGQCPMRKETFRDKPERVIHLPESVLPQARIDEFLSIERLAIVEIAGRDSVAAAVEAVRTEGFTDLLPTYAYTGTECGNWATVEDAVLRLSKRLPHTRVHPLLILGSPRFWQALNGRFMGELIRRYGGFSPCVGCHLYLHSVRIPLALTLGRRPIISGERELHDGSVKINQTGEALSCYQSLTEEFKIRLLFPLRHVAAGHRITEILGFEWEEGKAQLGCVLSGNYRGAEGHITLSTEQIVQYLKGFGCPLTRDIIAAYLKGRIPPHLEMAGRRLVPDP